MAPDIPAVEMKVNVLGQAALLALFRGGPAEGFFVGGEEGQAVRCCRQPADQGPERQPVHDALAAVPGRPELNRLQILAPCRLIHRPLTARPPAAGARNGSASQRSPDYRSSNSFSNIASNGAWPSASLLKKANTVFPSFSQPRIRRAGVLSPSRPYAPW